MASKTDPRTRLEAKRQRILDQIDKDTARAGKVFDGLGHGYAMRAYHRLKKMSTRVADELKERLDTVEKELIALGWHDPKKPVEPERTQEEIMAHYCEVMDLNFEEEMAKIKARKTAEIAQ